MLVVVCGLPGTGKSTVSSMVAETVGARRVRTDVVRKELHPDPTYSAAESRATYDAVLDRARAGLTAGESVVLDGTFRRRRDRASVRALAAEAGVDLRIVRVVCAAPVARRRLREREDDPSDADVDVYEQLRGEFEPVEGDHLVVDNSGSLAATREQVEAAFPD